MIYCRVSAHSTFDVESIATDCLKMASKSKAQKSKSPTQITPTETPRRGKKLREVIDTTLE